MVNRRNLFFSLTINDASIDHGIDHRTFFLIIFINMDKSKTLSNTTENNMINKQRYFMQTKLKYDIRFQIQFVVNVKFDKIDIMHIKILTTLKKKLVMVNYLSCVAHDK